MSEAKNTKSTSCIQFRNHFKPLKKWVQLPSCIRQVCKDRDDNDKPVKTVKGPVKVEELMGKESEKEKLLENEEVQMVQEVRGRKSCTVYPYLYQNIISIFNFRRSRYKFCTCMNIYFGRYRTMYSYQFDFWDDTEISYRINLIFEAIQNFVHVSI